MNKKLKVALAGIGSRGKDTYAPTAELFPDKMEIVAIADIDDEKVKEVAKECNRKVIVCHVLRYTPIYSKLKDILDCGIIGDVVSVMSIENVGYWHQAHSFVRGNWRNSETTSPMILQKCCHDMDLLLWLTGKTCESISSFGDTYLFQEECAPKGATFRCMDARPKKLVHMILKNLFRTSSNWCKNRV